MAFQHHQYRIDAPSRISREPNSRPAQIENVEPFPQIAYRVGNPMSRCFCPRRKKHQPVEHDAR